MNLRVVVGLALSGMALMGCPTPTTTDAGAMVDARPAVDAEVTNEGGVVMDTGTDAPLGSDAPVPDAPVGATTWSGSVHASVRTSCGPCHAGGGSGGHNMAAVDDMMSFTDSQLPSTVCAGLTKGACAARRVRDGSMPAGGPLPEPARTQLADLLDRWVAGGQTF